MIKKLKESRGFTLIEVVIVLAIAALIILVVLQAVSAAQRANRDTTRKNDAGRIVSMLEQSASNRAGVYPSSAANADTEVAQYDAGLSTKYAFTAGPAYASGTAWAPTTAACSGGTTGAEESEVIYSPAANLRDYRMAVCLEGTIVTVVK